MKKAPYLLLFGLSILLFSCKKDDPTIDDHRNNVIGNYHFTIIKYTSVMGDPTTYDTSLYNGIVKKFEFKDVQDNGTFTAEELDQSSMSDEDFNKKVTIAFTDDHNFIGDLNNDRTFNTKSGIHYHQDGRFTGDSLYLNITGLGGLGFSTGYYISGIKSS